MILLVQAFWSVLLFPNSMKKAFSNSLDINRRTFFRQTALGSVVLAYGQSLWAADDTEAIRKEIGKRHNEAVNRLQKWIHQPSIAAENNGVSEGCELTMRFLREAGFQKVSKMPTDGQPGIFAELDAG